MRLAHLLGMDGSSLPVVREFLTQHELAERVKVPERTLEDWRLHHVGRRF
jgi:hypothetical protein